MEAFLLGMGRTGRCLGHGLALAFAISLLVAGIGAEVGDRSEGLRLIPLSVAVTAPGRQPLILVRTSPALQPLLYHFKIFFSLLL